MASEEERRSTAAACLAEAAWQGAYMKEAGTMERAILALGTTVGSTPVDGTARAIPVDGTTVRVTPVDGTMVRATQVDGTRLAQARVPGNIPEARRLAGTTLEKIQVAGITVEATLLAGNMGLAPFCILRATVITKKMACLAATTRAACSEIKVAAFPVSDLRVTA